MPEISALIITLNEEKNIERCIKSISDLADEIVVIDSFSTDKTEEISKKYNVKFVKHKFEGHIEQKNYAITQAKYPHVLSIDADEELSDELIESIKEVKNNWTHDGYYFNRLTNYCGKWIKHCGWYPDQKLRLWDSRKGSWQGENPHDKYALKPGSTQKHLKGDLFHYCFYTMEQHMDQINKFSSIKAMVAYNKGKKSSCLKMYINPIFKFVKDFYFKRGFLDGYYGYVICRNSAHSNFLKYAKLKMLYKNKKE